MISAFSESFVLDLYHELFAVFLKQGKVVAQRIAAAILGDAATATFDGKGFCYLEMGAGRAVRAEGSFFELPHPVMQKRAPDEAQLQDKLAWVARSLGRT